MPVKEFAEGTTSRFHEPNKREWQRIRRRFGRNLATSNSYTVSFFNTSATSYSEGEEEWEDLDAIEPRGKDLDAIMARFPAPAEWYEE